MVTFWRFVVLVWLIIIAHGVWTIHEDQVKANKIACIQLDYMGADPATKTQRDPCN